MVRACVAAAPGARIIASPLAKKLAFEKGIDLSALSGTGPHNRIIAADVKEYVPSGAFSPPRLFAMTVRTVMQLRPLVLVPPGGTQL